MKMKFKNFMSRLNAYCEENDMAIINLGYAGIAVGTVIYLICASYSVLKYGISYRR